MPTITNIQSELVIRNVYFLTIYIKPPSIAGNRVVIKSLSLNNKIYCALNEIHNFPKHLNFSFESMIFLIILLYVAEHIGEVCW